MSRLKQIEAKPEGNRQMEIYEDYEKRARAEKGAGGEIRINYDVPYIKITMSDGSRHEFQDEDAQELLDEVPDEIDAESYILAIAQDW